MVGAHPAIDILLDQRNWKQAEPLIRDVLRESPNDARLLSSLALCMINTDRVRQSRAVLGAALESDANYAFTHYLCGHAARQGAKPLTRNAFESQRSLTRRHAKLARPYFREALRLDPENASYFEAASDNALELGDTRDAISLAQQGLERNPEHPGCLNALSSAMSASGHLNDAQRASLAALASNPDDAYTHANRGWLLLRTGQNEDALTHFRSSLRQHPDSLWARLGLKEAIKRRFKPYAWAARPLRWCREWDKTQARKWGVIAGVPGGLTLVSFAGLWTGLTLEGKQSSPSEMLLTAFFVSVFIGIFFGLLLILVMQVVGRSLQNTAEYTLLFSPDGRVALTPSERVRMTAWLLFWSWFILLMVVLFAQPWVWLRAAVMIFGLPAVALLTGLLSPNRAALTRMYWVVTAVGFVMAGFLGVTAIWNSVEHYENLAVVWLLCILGLPVAMVVAVQRALPEELRDE